MSEPMTVGFDHCKSCGHINHWTHQPPELCGMCGRYLRPLPTPAEGPETEPNWCLGLCGRTAPVENGDRRAFCDACEAAGARVPGSSPPPEGPETEKGRCWWCRHPKREHAPGRARYCTVDDCVCDWLLPSSPPPEGATRAGDETAERLLPDDVHDLRDKAEALRRGGYDFTQWAWMEHLAWRLERIIPTLSQSASRVEEAEARARFAETFAPPNATGAHTMAALLDDLAEYKRRADSLASRVETAEREREKLMAALTPGKWLTMIEGNPGFGYRITVDGQPRRYADGATLAEACARLIAPRPSDPPSP